MSDYGIIETARRAMLDALDHAECPPDLPARLERRRPSRNAEPTELNLHIILCRVDPSETLMKSQPRVGRMNNQGVAVELDLPAYYLDLTFALIATGPDLGETYRGLGWAMQVLGGCMSLPLGRYQHQGRRLPFRLLLRLEDTDGHELRHLVNAVNDPLAAAAFYRATVKIDRDRMQLDEPVQAGVPTLTDASGNDRQRRRTLALRAARRIALTNKWKVVAESLEVTAIDPENPARRPLDPRVPPHEHDEVPLLIDLVFRDGRDLYLVFFFDLGGDGRETPAEIARQRACEDRLERIDLVTQSDFGRGCILKESGLLPKALRKMHRVVLLLGEDETFEAITRLHQMEVWHA